MIFTEEREKLQENNIDEVKRLKIKINALLDVIEKQKRFNVEGPGEILGSTGEEKIFTYVVNIIKFLRRLQEANLWMDYKNNTVITKEYYRIDKSDFEAVLQEVLDPSLNPSTFIGLMGKLGIMKIASTQNNLYMLHSVVVKGKSRRVYLVRKTSIGLSLEG